MRRLDSVHCDFGCDLNINALGHTVLATTNQHGTRFTGSTPHSICKSEVVFKMFNAKSFMVLIHSFVCLALKNNEEDEE